MELFSIKIRCTFQLVSTRQILKNPFSLVLLQGEIKRLTG